MNFKTVKKLISCALPAWLLLGSGQNLLGSARICSVLVGSRGFMLYQVRFYSDTDMVMLGNF